MFNTLHKLKWGMRSIGMKRAFACFLIVCLVTGIIPLQVLAEENLNAANQNPNPVQTDVIQTAAPGNEGLTEELNKQDAVVSLDNSTTTTNTDNNSTTASTDSNNLSNIAEPELQQQPPVDDITLSEEELFKQFASEDVPPVDFASPTSLQEIYKIYKDNPHFRKENPKKFEIYSKKKKSIVESQGLLQADAMSVNSTGDGPQAEAVSLQNYINNIASRRSVNYSDAPKLADRYNQKEDISEQNGSLTLRHSDLYLPGKDGLDLDISRFYNSSQSEIGTKKVIIKMTIPNNTTGTLITGCQLYLQYKGRSSDTLWQLGGLSKFDNFEAAYLKGEELKNDDSDIENYYVLCPEDLSTCINPLEYYIHTEFYSYTDSDNYLRYRYDLGAGWSFGFPSVQDRNNDLGPNTTLDPTDVEFKTFHDGKGNAYEVKITDDLNDSNLVDYQGKDVVFDLAETLGKSYTNPDTGESAFYAYIEQGNKQYYFTSDGRLIGIKDRLGNEIKFSYVNRTVKIPGSARPWETSSGDSHNNKYISTITDTVGRTVNFNYVDNLDSNGQFSSGQIDITVHDPNDNSRTLALHYVKDTFSCSYTQYFWNYSDDDQQYVITAQDTGVRLEPRLSSYTDSDNKTNSYEYYGTDYYANYSTKQSIRFYYDYKYNVSYDTLCLLKKITYPQSCTYYEYGKKTRCWASLRELYDDYIISKRYDTELRDVNGAAVESSAINQAAYSYVWDYTTARVKTCDYSSTSIINGLTTTSTYNKGSQMKSIVATDGLKTKQINNSAWSSTFKFKPTNSSTTESDSSGSVVVLNITTYNDCGGVDTYTDGITGSQMVDRLRKYYYTDPINKFMLTKKEWNQNTSTPVNETYEYNSSGRLIKSTNANGESVSYNYSTDSSGEIKDTTTTLEDGKTAHTSEICGAQSNNAYPTEIRKYYTGATNGYAKTTMTYDMLLGLPETVTDDANHQTVYTYDDLGRVTLVQMPDAGNYSVKQVYSYQLGVTSPLFDATNANLLTTRVDSSIVYTNKTTGQEQAYQQHQQYYNAFGQLILDAVYDQQNNNWIIQAQCHYDNYGRVVYQADALGNTNTYQYDSWDNLINSADPFNNEYQETISYSGGNKLVTDSFQAAGSSTPEHILETYCDPWDKVIKQKDQATGLTELYDYDVVGNVVKHTDPMSNITSYDYDKLNQLIKVTDPLNQINNYSYTRLGKLKNMSITEGTTTYTTSWTYDEIGQPKTKSDPAGLTDTLNYNNLGLLVNSTDPNGNTFTNTYDSQNRVTNQSGGGIAFQYQYGNHPYGAENISLNNGSTVSYTYDGLGRMNTQTTTADSVSKTVNYQYDVTGKVTNMTGPAGPAVSYSYDHTRLSQLQYDGQAISYEYYPDGMLKSRIYPAFTDGSILKSSYEYDGQNRLTKLSNTKGTTVLSEYQYTYDNNNNIKTVTDASGTSTYDYDKLNRLIKISKPNGQTVSYTYDARGNRKSTVGNNPVNVVEESYSYNALNQLTSAVISGQTTSYSYDPTGMRFKKTTPTTTTRYIYDKAGRVIAEEDGSNQGMQYIWGPDRLLIKKDNAGQKYYYIYNGHGDVVQILDTAGNIVNSYEYDEWGNILNQTETIANDFKYAGEIQDSETGFYYLRARYYDPAIGRFISKDSVAGNIVNPLSLNLYSYCENDPLGNIDPSGHMPGDKFTSPDLAAKDFAYYYAAITQYLRLEQSSLCFMVIERQEEKTNIWYSYTKPLIGEPHACTISMKDLPKDTVFYGFLHTHPNSSEFSDEDRDSAKKYWGTTYLVTPDNDVLKYTYSRNRRMTKAVAYDVSVKTLSSSQKEKLANKYLNVWVEHLKKEENKNPLKSWICNDIPWPAEPPYLAPITITNSGWC